MSRGADGGEAACLSLDGRAVTAFLLRVQHLSGEPSATKETPPAGFPIGIPRAEGSHELPSLASAAIASEMAKLEAAGLSNTSQLRGA